MNAVRLIGLIALLICVAGVGASRAMVATAQPEPPNAPNQPEWHRATVVYLVRHAETDPNAGRDPELTEAGAARAERLAHMLSDEEIAATFVTDTIRSRATAAPTLDMFGLGATQYAPMDFAALAARIRSDHAGRRVLVVAHSNTVPGILRALGGPDTPDLEHAEFDRLYVVVTPPGGEPTTLGLRF